MTTLIPYLLPVLQQPPPDKAQSMILSMIVIVLLLALLIEKEFIRAYGTINIRAWRGVINNVSWTLFGVFIFLITMRFLGFILN